MWARFAGSFVSWKRNLCPSFITVILQAVLCYNRPCYRKVRPIVYNDKDYCVVRMFKLIEAEWHICIYASVNRAIIGPENDLSPDRRQATIWPDYGILLMGPLGTKPSEIVNKIHVFSFTKMHPKISSGKWQPSCLGLNVLNLISSFSLFPMCIYFGCYRSFSLPLIFSIILCTQKYFCFFKWIPMKGLGIKIKSIF